MPDLVVPPRAIFAWYSWQSAEMIPDISSRSRQGALSTVEMRAAAQIEGISSPPRPSSSFFFRSGRRDATSRPLARLAQRSGSTRELTLTGRAGRRLSRLRQRAYGTSCRRNGPLSLCSDADLSQRWINVLQFELARDWTWDGLAENGLAVRRTARAGTGQPDVVELAGTVAVPRTIPRLRPQRGTPTAGSARAIQPHRLHRRDRPQAAKRAGQPISGRTGRDLRDQRGAPRRGAAAGSVVRLGLLPITTPPVQVPHWYPPGSRCPV